MRFSGRCRSGPRPGRRARRRTARGRACTPNEGRPNRPSRRSATWGSRPLAGLALLRAVAHDAGVVVLRDREVALDRVRHDAGSADERGRPRRRRPYPWTRAAVAAARRRVRIMMGSPCCRGGGEGASTSGARSGQTAVQRPQRRHSPVGTAPFCAHRFEFQNLLLGTDPQAVAAARAARVDEADPHEGFGVEAPDHGPEGAQGAEFRAPEVGAEGDLRRPTPARGKAREARPPDDVAPEKPAGSRARTRPNP